MRLKMFQSVVVQIKFFQMNQIDQRALAKKNQFVKTQIEFFQRRKVKGEIFVQQSKRIVRQIQRFNAVENRRRTIERGRGKTRQTCRSDRHVLQIIPQRVTIEIKNFHRTIFQLERLNNRIEAFVFFDLLVVHRRLTLNF